MAKVTKDGKIDLTAAEVLRHTQRSRSVAYFTRKNLRLIPNIVLEDFLRQMEDDDSIGLTISKKDVKAVLKYKQEKGMV